MLFLPSSAVAAWTYPVDYVAELKHLRAAYTTGPGAVLPGAPAVRDEAGRAGERGCSGIWTGETVFMIGRESVRPRGESREGQELLMPTLAMAVAVDDPESVDSTLEEIAGNLLRVVNLPSMRDNKIAIHSETLSDADEATLIRSIPLATLFSAGTVRELLGSLELSWAVARSPAGGEYEP